MIKEAYKNFIDDIGQVHPALHPKVGQSQNGLRWTSEYMMLLKRYGELTDADIDSYRNMVKLCMVEPGLLSRFPGSGEQEGPDDYYALLAACYFLGIKDIPKLILNYGRTNNYIYNNVSPGKFTGSAFLGRQLPLVACMHYAAGETPNFFLRCALKVSLWLSSRSSGKKNQDAKALGYFQMLIATTMPEYAGVIKTWWESLYAEFTGGMQEVLKKYFAYDEYPTVVYWKE